MNGFAKIGTSVVKRYRSSRSTRRQPEPQIPLTPLIDVVLNLLIFFMLITKFLTPGIAVALPESRSGSVDEANFKTVSIDSGGNTYINDVPATLAEIEIELAAFRETGEIETVRLRADSRTPYQKIIDALDAISAAGITDVLLETSQRETGEDETYP